MNYLTFFQEKLILKKRINFILHKKTPQSILTTTLITTTTEIYNIRNDTMMMMNRRHTKGFGRMKKEKEKKAKKKEKEEENKLIRESEENSSSLSSKDEAHSTQNILVTNVKRKSGADYDEDKDAHTTTCRTTTTTTTTSANTTRNCRICMCEESRSMPFVQLRCTCKGAMAFAHKVLKRFFSSKYYSFDFLLSLSFLLFVLTMAFKIILHITS